MVTAFMYYYWDPTYFLVIIGAVLLDVTRERMEAKARRLAAK